MLIKRPPHIILASDIAGLGKVATTAALPLLASCQLEVAVLPTVLLSSHTGGFPGAFVESYTQGMEQFIQQWSALEIEFSALVTGYLRDKKQIELLLELAEKQELPLIVDPIMGDNERLYAGFDETFVVEMRRLASQAKLLLPNLTESCLLLNRDYPDQALTEQDYLEVCQDLHALGAESIVLTGLPLSETELGLAFYDGKSESFQLFSRPRLPQHFFGTGDMVTALLAGAWVQKIPLTKAIPALLDFLQLAMQTTVEVQPDLRLGVFYQPFLGQWTQQFQVFLEEKYEKESL